MRIDPHIASLLLTSLAACAAANTPPTTGGTVAAPALTVASAANTIAAASCEHERRCNASRPEAGPMRTSYTCEADYVASASTDLASHPCPAGIDASHLSACATMLESESCHPLSTISRMVACSPAALCVQIAAVHITEDEAYGP